MAWMARTASQRRDVQKVLPGARSVIVVAKNYFAPRPKAHPCGGRVSRYAWGRDYHRVMAKPLRRLARYISELQPGAQWYVSIDTGPVAERAWAERAGVGWIGKNGLAIRQGLGSWFFLGVVITTAALAVDSPAMPHCGTCQRCLEACPTRAIVEPGVIDARRCIAYHTIENRGAIPEELACRFGDWLFGCDVCQEVCPWNRSARVTTDPAFEPRPENACIDPGEVFSMDEAAFAARFAGSPIRRATLDGLKRNGRIVIGNGDRGG